MTNLQLIHNKLLDFYEELRSGYYPQLEAGGITDLHDKKEDAYGAGRFSNILRSKQTVVALPYSDFKLFDEFAFITQDIKYILGVLSVLRPHINNPGQEGGTYLQTLEDHLYLRYSSFGYQSVYLFWDRVGDLLYLYFPTGIKSRNVSLGSVIEKIPQVYKSTPCYKDLLEFYNSKIRSIIDVRHDIVHHFGLKSSHRWAIVEHRSDQEKLAEKFQEKYGYRDDLEEQLLNCLEGYLLMLALIDCLPDKQNAIS